ncbi:putative prohead protease [Bacillus phage Kirov]|uniref:Putative prohead protease n=2 Tax=Viruses TaxID=10239 RepID=A0A7S6RBM7_9CAUD|nr:putative prohead protease [Bacillus phage Kirov]QOV08233.1 putative prohead protease [Bacillus phage Kirov]
MGKKLDFQSSISEVKQINPTFSTCKVRVLYTGKNRNMSIITREAVDKALPTIYNIPIVGEFMVENQDYKGHGGKLDLDSYKFIHTTKPYGVVPESAKYGWETVKGADGQVREYLTIEGCYLWTGRYEEAFSVVNKGKGQSMEIEVTNGEWVDSEEAYRIDDFVFSALCILGDDVEPAFEDANIVAYSFNKDSFKEEFSQMLDELKVSLNEEKEVINLTLQELLEKYSITVDELESAGVVVEGIEGEALETVISDFAKKKKDDKEEEKPEDKKDAPKEEKPEDKAKSTDDKEEKPSEKKDEEKPSDKKEEKPADKKEDKAPSDKEEDEEDKKKKKGKFSQEDYDALLAENTALKADVAKLTAFKKAVEDAQHEEKVFETIANLGLTDEDEGVAELKEQAMEITLEQLEEKCYSLLGRKAFASKKQFSKEKEKETVRIQFEQEKQEDKQTSSNPYGDLFEKFNN